MPKAGAISVELRRSQAVHERVGRPALVPGAPAIHAAQHERAGRAENGKSATGSTAGGPLRENSQRHGHLTRSRPRGSPSNTAASQWEPRKPLARTRRPRHEDGAKVASGGFKNVAVMRRSAFSKTGALPH